MNREQFIRIVLVLFWVSLFTNFYIHKEKEYLLLDYYLIMKNISIQVYKFQVRYSLWLFDKIKYTCHCYINFYLSIFFVRLKIIYCSQMLIMNKNFFRYFRYLFFRLSLTLTWCLSGKKDLQNLVELSTPKGVVNIWHSGNNLWFFLLVDKGLINNYICKWSKL